MMIRPVARGRWLGLLVMIPIIAVMWWSHQTIASKTVLPAADPPQRQMAEQFTKQEGDVGQKKMRPNGYTTPMENEGKIDHTFLKMILTEYEATINQPKTQIDLVESLMDYINAYHADNSTRELFTEYIRKGFPNRSHELMAKFEALSAYRSWVSENKHWMATLSRYRLNALLQEKQELFFGPEADTIWEDQRRWEILRSEIATIETSGDWSLHRQMDYLMDKGDELSERSQQHTVPVFLSRMDRISLFLNLEAVQDNLHKMDNADRKQSLQQIRRKIGFDDASISKMAKLDSKRDQRWQTGQTYMQERNRLAKESNGKVGAGVFNALRMKHFRDQSELIKAEEEAGFFRFAEKRRYGLN